MEISVKLEISRKIEMEKKDGSKKILEDCYIKIKMHELVRQAFM